MDEASSRLLDILSTPPCLDFFAQAMDAGVATGALAALRADVLAAFERFEELPERAVLDELGAALLSRIEEHRKARARAALSRIVLPVLDAIERIKALGSCVWTGEGCPALHDEWERRYGEPMPAVVATFRVGELTACCYDEERLALLHESAGSVAVELYETRPAEPAELATATEGA